ncbi:VanZ like family protein [Rhizobium sp. NFR07]|uniref:VanZ family protein n=1 Tax=Rhizobium sp. NFR07 TaxID=1566262 RepID=UPI0008EE0903|nr:VanZ family protein [Rhizobium sp. NFR07]SFB46026.1 VanZ like family protein [Rhizobium sp. NFR07]
MTTRLLKLLPWLALAAIIFATVSPIRLRPHDFASVDIDRAGAFAVMALLFVVAYPRRWVACAILLILGAGGIELLQFLSPTRHAHLDDAMVKAAGAAFGCLLGLALNRTVTRYRQPAVA